MQVVGSVKLFMFGPRVLRHGCTVLVLRHLLLPRLGLL